MTCTYEMDPGIA
jgi:DNA topoisomerase-2